MYKQWLVLTYLENPADFPQASTCLQLSVPNHATAHTRNVGINMKKTIILISIAIALSSCHIPKYTLETITPIVDFRVGKWLLNDIQSPNSIKPILKNTAFEKFSYFLNDRLYDLSNTNGIITPYFIPLNPNRELLNDLKNGTGFDYFINIKGQALKNELFYRLGSLVVGRPQASS